jgi:GR25 family glycosyltransferase involved in LPS biosynthesis
MNLTEYFQRIYVINLPQRRDRRREMARQLKMIGTGFSSPGVRLFEAVRPQAPDGFPSIGARGAFLSHMKILQEASAQQLQKILILEDDLDFIPDFSSRIEAVVEELEREDWSVFYGGYVLPDSLEPQSSQALIPADPSLRIQTAHFIGFRGSAIGEMVDYLEAMLNRPGGDPRGGPMHVDGAYSWYRQAFPHRLTLLATPQLGFQRSSRSDIHDLRWFDRVPGVRHTVAGIRQLRNRVCK